MASHDKGARHAGLAGCGAMLMALAACTVFNGRSVPATTDGGVEGGFRDGGDGGPACDPGALGSDARNCGACGHDCAGGACTGGACQPVVLVPAGDAGGVPIDLAVDDTYVFWASDDGSVHRIGKDGSAPLVLASFGMASGDARIAVDSAAVYYANAATAAVYALSKDGTTRSVVHVEANGFRPVSLASSGAALYWAHVSGSNVGGIMRAWLPSDGGVTEVWPNRQFPEEIAVDDRFLYWSENYTSITQAAADGTGNDMTLSGCSRPAALALGDASVYWTSDAGVTLTAKGDPASNCLAPSAQVVAKDGAGPFGLALGGGLVAWTDSASGEVRAAPATGVCAGTCPRTLATGQTSPGRAAADDHAVYWVNGDGSVVTVAF